MGIDPDFLTISTTFTCHRRGMEAKIIAGDQAPEPDQTLIRALRNAHRWANELKLKTPIKQIAANNTCSVSYARGVSQGHPKGKPFEIAREFSGEP